MVSGENINAEVGTLDNPSATGANPDLPGFTVRNLDKHFGSKFGSDHSNQYTHFTKEQYAQRAHGLVKSPVSDNVLGYKTSGGDVVRFDESTNDFVKGSKNGIRTMFKPEEGTKYFERQMLRDGGATDD